MDSLKNKWKYYLSALGFSSAFFAFLYAYKKYYKNALTCKNLNINLFPLEKYEANDRTNSINPENLKYTLFLNLKDKNTMNNEFEGSVLIEFGMKNVVKTFLDFHGELKKVTVNGKVVESYYNRDRIYLSASDLSKENKVLIEFKCNYSKTEHGLRFLRADDFESYITSNFEPFYAHTVFPCFNQLDLKANIKLFLAIHKEFNGISSGIILT